MGPLSILGPHLEFYRSQTSGGLSGNPTQPCFQEFHKLQLLKTFFSKVATCETFENGGEVSQIPAILKPLKLLKCRKHLKNFFKNLKSLNRFESFKHFGESGTTRPGIELLATSSKTFKGSGKNVSKI